MNHDRTFSADIPYLFFANTIYDARKLSDCISIALRMKTICLTDKQHKLQAKDSMKNQCRYTRRFMYLCAILELLLHTGETIS